MSDIQSQIWAIRQEADNLPNWQDYPISNMLTLIENLEAGSVTKEMAGEIKIKTAKWIAELFEAEKQEARIAELEAKLAKAIKKWKAAEEQAYDLRATLAELKDQPNDQ